MNAITKRGPGRVLPVLAATTLFAGCAMQPLATTESTREPPSRERVFSEQLLKQYSAFVGLLTGKEHPCGSDNPCKVNVPVAFVVNGAGDEFCLAKFPSKISWNRNNPPGPRRVEWTLVPETGVTKTFSFDAEFGILPFRNANQLGSGPSNHGLVPSTSGKTFFYVHSNGQSGVTHPVKYLSVIWLDPPGGAEPTTTCGTIDPIIANDG